MAAHGEVILDWGDGQHTFNISKIAQILELQDKCGAGIGTIHSRLRNGTFFFYDFREVVRLGLIGGGMKPVDALVLTRRYVDERPWHESVLTATAIIMAAFIGVPATPVGKKKRKRREAPTMTESSTAPVSTASAPL